MSALAENLPAALSSDSQLPEIQLVTRSPSQQNEIPTQPIDPALSRLMSYGVSEKDAKVFDANAQAIYRKPSEPIRMSRRRFVGGLAAALSAATGVPIVLLGDTLRNPPSYPEIKKQIPDTLIDGDPINGLEDSIYEMGRMYFGYDALLEKAKSASGSFGFLTDGDPPEQLLFYNADKDFWYYNGVDLVNRDGKEYLRMVTPPTQKDLFVRTFDKGGWQDRQKLPVSWQTFTDGKRRINWQSDVAVSNPLMQYVLSHAEHLSLFFPNATAPDVTVRISDPEGEVVRKANYPDGNEPKLHDPLILDTDKLVDFGDAAQIGILQGIANHFLSHIDMMLFENNTSTIYDPRTVSYVWDHIRPQLEAKSSLRQPENWPKDKPFTLFDSIFHPAVYNGDLMGLIDLPATPANAIASMLYLSSYSELHQQLRDRFNQLTSEYIPNPSIRDINWNTSVETVKHEQGVIRFAVDPLFRVLEAGTNSALFDAQFPYFKVVFDTEPFTDSTTDFDPWAESDTTLDTSVAKQYGEYTAGVSKIALLNTDADKATKGQKH